jgi:hypothetical protein
MTKVLALLRGHIAALSYPTQDELEENHCADGHPTAVVPISHYGVAG